MELAWNSLQLWSDPWLILNLCSACVLALLLLVANAASIERLAPTPPAKACAQRGRRHSLVAPSQTCSQAVDLHPAPERSPEVLQAARQQRQREAEALCLESCRKKNSPDHASLPEALHAPSPPTPAQAHDYGTRPLIGSQSSGSPCTPSATEATAPSRQRTPARSVYTQTTEELLPSASQPRRRSSSSSSSSSSNGGGSCGGQVLPPAQATWNQIHTAPLFDLPSSGEEVEEAEGPRRQAATTRRSSSSSSSSSNAGSLVPLGQSHSPAARRHTDWAHIHTPLYNIGHSDEEGEGDVEDQPGMASARPPLPSTDPLRRSWRDASPCRQGYSYNDMSGNRSTGGKAGVGVLGGGQLRRSAEGRGGWGAGEAGGRSPASAQGLLQGQVLESGGVGSGSNASTPSRELGSGGRWRVRGSPGSGAGLARMGRGWSPLAKDEAGRAGGMGRTGRRLFEEQAAGGALRAVKEGAAGLSPPQELPQPPLQLQQEAGKDAADRAIVSNEAQLAHEVQVWQQRAAEAEQRRRELEAEAHSVLLQCGWLEEELAYSQEQEETAKVDAAFLEARLRRMEAEHQQLLQQLAGQLGVQASPLQPWTPTDPSPGLSCDPAFDIRHRPAAAPVDATSTDVGATSTD